MPTYVVRANALSLNATGQGNQRKFARASDGRLWAAYRAGLPTIYVAYSDDEGVTWTEELIAVAAAQQNPPSIAIDSSDNLHVIWEGLGWGVNVADFNIQYRMRSGAGVWSPQVGLTDLAFSSYDPVIAVDSHDNVHAAWHGQGYLPMILWWSIVYQVRTAGIWGAQEIVIQSAADQNYASIAIDSGDVVHLVWSGGFDIQYNQRTGVGWGVQEPVTNVNGQEVPCIALDSNDNPHIAWTGRNWGLNPAMFNIQYCSRIAGVWGAREPITDLPNQQRWATISLDANDVVYVSWRGFGWGANPGDYNVVLNIRTAGVWGAVQSVTDRTLDQGLAPSFIWAEHPTGNIPNNGCAMLYTGALPPWQVEYYYPSAPWTVVPTVTTDAATDILQELATLNGTLDDDGGEACDCGFEWGETPAYGNTTPTQSRTTGQTFSQIISGLSPGITYHFRAFATNSVGTGYGADRTFTTQELLRVNRAFALAREEL